MSRVVAPQGAKVTEREIAYAIELLDAPGGDDAEDEVLRILKRDMSEAHARRVLRAAIDAMSGGEKRRDEDRS